MPDPFAKVQLGDPVPTSASAINAMLGAGRAWQSSQLGGGASALLQTRDAAIIRVRNDTGAALARRSVLGIDGPIFTPTDSEDVFLRDVWFKGVTPAAGHRGKFCITLEPAVPDQVVRAFVAGVCSVRVYLSDPNDAACDIEAGTHAHLNSAGGGSAQILWTEADEGGYAYDDGEMWAVVRLGEPPDTGIAKVGATHITTTVYGTAGHQSGTIWDMDDAGNLYSTGVSITLYNLSTEKAIKASAFVQYKRINGRAVIDWADCGNLE